MSFEIGGEWKDDSLILRCRKCRTLQNSGPVDCEKTWLAVARDFTAAHSKCKPEEIPAREDKRFSGKLPPPLGGRDITDIARSAYAGNMRRSPQDDCRKLLSYVGHQDRLLARVAAFRPSSWRSSDSFMALLDEIDSFQADHSEHGPVHNPERVHLVGLDIAVSRVEVEKGMGPYNCEECQTRMGRYDVQVWLYYDLSAVEEGDEDPSGYCVGCAAKRGVRVRGV